MCVLSVRQAAQRASKRVKMSSSEESDDDSEQDGSSSGSEFKLSGSDSVDTDSPTEDSNASSDFNPFETDTDSDAGSVDLSLWGKWRQGCNIKQFFVFVNTGKDKNIQTVRIVCRRRICEHASSS